MCLFKFDDIQTMLLMLDGFSREEAYATKGGRVGIDKQYRGGMERSGC